MTPEERLAQLRDKVARNLPLTVPEMRELVALDASALDRAATGESDAESD